MNLCVSYSYISKDLFLYFSLCVLKVWEALQILEELTLCKKRKPKDKGVKTEKKRGQSRKNKKIFSFLF